MAKLTAVTRAAAEAASASKRRDDAIRSAHADGATIRAIAAAAGLSSARIHQIVHAKDTDDLRDAIVRHGFRRVI